MRRTYVPMAIVASLALVALLIYGVVGVGSSTTIYDAVQRGEGPPAPDRTLPLLEGGDASLADWRGKPVIVNFWASWCEPCKDEAPLLERAHARLKRAGGTVLGVTIQDARDDSKAFVREFGLSFPNVRDVEEELSDEYARAGVPETYVVDRTGSIVALRRGPVDKAFVDEALRLVGA